MWRMWHHIRYPLNSGLLHPTKLVVIVSWLFLFRTGVLLSQLKVDPSSPAMIMSMIALTSICLTCQFSSVTDAMDEGLGVVTSGTSVYP